MKIVKIHIDEFGPICDRTFEFDDALTIIRGDNESGKSTLVLFIKFALYGLSKRAKTSSVSEVDKAISHSSDNAKGSMIVSHLGKLYRIDRQLKKGAKSMSERVQVTDLETSLKCDYGASPGEFFLGIPAEVFENSCGIAQLGCSTVKGEQISTAIRNLLSSADESIDYQKAIKALDNVRIKLLHKDKKGGSIYNLTAKKEELESSYRKAVDDSCETERIEADLKKINDKIEEVSSKQKIADELSSKITLRSVIKLFDKMHEYEDDRKTCQNRIGEIESTLNKGTLSFDRSFLAKLSSAKNELEISFDEYNTAKKETTGFTFKTSKDDAELIRKLDNAGGIEAVSAILLR